MERTRSLPPHINPFWSMKASDEFRLARARPVDLPVPDDQDLQSPRIRKESRGKGLGERQVANGSQERMVPPESWETPAGAVGDGDGESFRKGEIEGRTESALERELGEELVRHLMEENQKLRNDLKRAHEQGSHGRSSIKSWSEVGGAAVRSQGPMPMSVAMGYSPETKRSEKGEEMVRCTPNGTRIPDGPPLEEPEVPPPPGWAVEDLAGYQKVEMSWKSRMRRDEEWKPRRRPEDPDQSLKCLAEEVEALQHKLSEMRTIGNGQGYWAENFRSPELERYEDWEEVHRDADRAWMERDCRGRGPNEYGGDRALAWRGKEFQGAEVRCGDRVFLARGKACPGGEARCSDRVFAARGGECQGDGATRRKS